MLKVLVLWLMANSLFAASHPLMQSTFFSRYFDLAKGSTETVAQVKAITPLMKGYPFIVVPDRAAAGKFIDASRYLDGPYRTVSGWHGLARLLLTSTEFEPPLSPLERLTIQQPGFMVANPKKVEHLLDLHFSDLQDTRLYVLLSAVDFPKEHRRSLVDADLRIRFLYRYFRNFLDAPSNNFLFIYVEESLRPESRPAQKVCRQVFNLSS